MTGIRSFNDTMALDRGILDMLTMPADVSPLPENQNITPPGALRGVVDDGIELTAFKADPLLEWIIEPPEVQSVLTPGGFQSALGNAAGQLSAGVREADVSPSAQAALRSCLRLVKEQLELIQLADINRSALMQG